MPAGSVNTPENGDARWMGVGAAVSLAASLAFWLLRRRLSGRIAFGFAVAFLERLREARLGAQVRKLFARGGAA